MSHADSELLASYNSLTDPHLVGYFANSRLRRQLRKAGLVTRDGMIVPESTYRMNWAKREQWQHAKETLAHAVLSETVDIERMRQAEFLQQLEEIAKVQSAQRIKEQREQLRREKSLPLLNPQYKSHLQASYSYSRFGHNKTRAKSGRRDDRHGRSEKRQAHSPKRRTHSIDSDLRREEDLGSESLTSRDSGSRNSLSSESSDSSVDRSVNRGGGRRQRRNTKHQHSAKRNYRQAWQKDSKRPHSPYAAIPPELKNRMQTPGSASSSQSSQHEQSKSAAAANSRRVAENVATTPRSLSPVKTKCMITMHYFGPNLNLSSDMFVDADEVMIEQQPAGGGSISVFRDIVQRASNFTFESHRYRSHPFSLTLYVNGRQDCRLSVCCEYKHKAGVRLGGKSGHFGIVKVQGSSPCYRCQLSSDQDKQKKKKEKHRRQKKVVKHARNDDSNEKNGLMIAIHSSDEEEKLSNNEDDEYKDDFDDNNSEASVAASQSSDATANSSEKNIKDGDANEDDDGKMSSSTLTLRSPSQQSDREQRQDDDSTDDEEPRTETPKATKSDKHDGKKSASPSRIRSCSSAKVSGKMVPKSNREPENVPKSDKDHAAGKRSKKSKRLSKSLSKSSDIADEDVQTQKGKSSKSDSKLLKSFDSCVEHAEEKRSKKSKSLSQSLRHTSSEASDKVAEDSNKVAGDSESDKNENPRSSSEPVRARKLTKEHSEDRDSRKSRSSSRSSTHSNSLNSSDGSHKMVEESQHDTAAGLEKTSDTENDKGESGTMDECNKGRDDVNKSEDEDKKCDDADVSKDLEDREAVDAPCNDDRDDSESHHLVESSSVESKDTDAVVNAATTAVHDASDEHTSEDLNKTEEAAGIEETPVDLSPQTDDAGEITEGDNVKASDAAADNPAEPAEPSKQETNEGQQNLDADSDDCDGDDETSTSSSSSSSSSLRHRTQPMGIPGTSGLI